MLHRALSALSHAALLPVRRAAQLVHSGQAHQHFLLPVLNGALGDQLAATHDPRAIQLSFRRDGHDVAVADLQLGDEQQKTVVFVHGLMGDELIWQTSTPAVPTDPPRYGPRLAAAAGVQVLYVRYNSGLHISHNGRALSDLLSELVRTYPNAVGELVLVGHSMGGLVIRSAGYYGAPSPAATLGADAPAPPPAAGMAPVPDTAPWLAHLRSVFLLGVPHDGSYVEQNSAAAERLLRRLNVLPTRLLSELLARRSDGIKDLGQARLVDADWQHPAADGPAPPRTPVPLLPGVAYHVLVGGLLRTGRAQALRDYFGDGLVGTASGQGRGLAPDEAHLPLGTTLRTARFEARHHGGLLHDEGVYRYVRRWL